MFTAYDNISNISAPTYRILVKALNESYVWRMIFNQDAPGKYRMSYEDVRHVSTSTNPASTLLHILEQRDITVYEFLERLQHLDRRFPNMFDRLQCVYMRKFKSVRWMNDKQILLKIDGDCARLTCAAGGFPTPSFIWYRKGVVKPVGFGRFITFRVCRCMLGSSFYCYARNSIGMDMPNGAAYREGNKLYASSLTSKSVRIPFSVPVGDVCTCTDGLDELDFVYPERPPSSQSIPSVYGSVASSISIDEDLIGRSFDFPEDDNIDYNATDKVALIISNSKYEHIDELLTPHCDAQALAQELQRMDFRTVTLGDLTMREMIYFLSEYKNLVDNKVYALFYFAGHGFEVNGQCYLLGTDVPNDTFSPQHSLSIDWVLSIFRDITPSLNVILLDICRRSIPVDNIPEFIDYSEKMKKLHKPQRNLVYGYSTSANVGAYEIVGEMNGVFMKYLKRHINEPVGVVDMLNNVLRDINDDEEVRHIQIPEIRSTLVEPRCLADQINSQGHTIAFHSHAQFWRTLHELPDPITIHFPKHDIHVLIWFQFCGQFTNKVYIYTSVINYYERYRLPVPEDHVYRDIDNYRADLKFEDIVDIAYRGETGDEVDGFSKKWLISNLQRLINIEETVDCVIDLLEVDPTGNRGTIVETREFTIQDLLITRIEKMKQIRRR